MAMKRKYSRRYGSRKRRRVSRRSSFWPTVSVRGRGIRGETKALDPLTLTAVQFTAAGTFTLLNGVATGSDFYNRIGQKVANRSLKLRIAVEPAVATSVSNELLRLVIFYDKQTNGAAPATADVLQAINASVTVTTNVWDGLNLYNRDRFVILRDKLFYAPQLNLTPMTLTGFEGALPQPTMRECIFQDFILLRGLETQYKGQTAAVNSIATGSIYMLTMGQVGGQFQAICSMRHRFTDN